MSAPRPRPGAASLALVAVTAVWGSTFPVIKDAVSQLPAPDLLAVRFAVASAALLLLFGRQALPGRPAAWWAVVYTAVGGAAVALLLRTWAQAQLPATRAAVIMTMEPVFAAGFAVILTGEHLGVRTVAGGGLVLAAMLLAELAPRRTGTADRQPPAELPHHEA